MRSFTFDVVDQMNADGHCRTVEGAKWNKLALKMVSEGRRLAQRYGVAR